MFGSKSERAHQTVSRVGSRRAESERRQENFEPDKMAVIDWKARSDGPKAQIAEKRPNMPMVLIFRCKFQAGLRAAAYRSSGMWSGPG